MKTLIEILGGVSLVLALTQAARGKEWRGMVPLHSTRADVERLLGPPFDESSYISKYKMRDDVVIVFYAEGPPCEYDTIRSGWMVPRDTVVEITINSPNWFPFSTLKIDRSKYKETRDGDVPDVSNYKDEEEGITYVVQTVVPPGMVDGKSVPPPRPGMVTSITYGPAAKDKHLRCPEASPAPNNGMHPTRDTLPVIHL